MRKNLFDLYDLTPEELVARITETIKLYNEKRATLTEEHVSRLRTLLSSDLYNFTIDVYKPALDDVMYTSIELDRVEGRLYVEHYDAFRKKEGASASETLARKAVKMDEIYIDAVKKAKTAENISNLYDKMMRMGTQVLHSMSYRGN